MPHLLETRYFQIASILLSALLIGWFFIDQGDVVLWLNQNRFALLDQIMIYMTLLGDGWFYGIVTLGILIWKWRLGLFFAIAGVIQAAITTFLKRIVFGAMPRPISFFEAKGIHLIPFDGVDQARLFTFPSGHTMTIFMLTALVSYTILHKHYHVLLLLLALLTGLSRIYLLQHFYRDVVAGAFLGILIASVLLVWLYPGVMRLSLKE